MFENPLERHEGTIDRLIIRYQPVHTIPIGFQTLFLHREGLSGALSILSEVSVVFLLKLT